MDRVAIFIDGGYLAKLLEEFGNEEVNIHGPARRKPAKIDFDKLAKEIAKAVGNVEILRTYYYYCLPYQSNPPSEEEKRRFSAAQGFFSQLRRLPRFEVREGRLAFRGCNQNGKPIYEQKRIDTLLALDLALLSGKRQITHAVLLTGDSDFVPVIKVVQSEGVLVWLFHGPTPRVTCGSLLTNVFVLHRILLRKSVCSLIAQLPFFPRGAHDGGPDALEMAVRMLRRHGEPRVRFV